MNNETDDVSVVSDVQEDIFSVTPPPAVVCNIWWWWWCGPATAPESLHTSVAGAVCAAVAAQQRHGREKAMCVCCVADGGWCWCLLVSAS